MVGVQHAAHRRAGEWLDGSKRDSAQSRSVSRVAASRAGARSCHEGGRSRGRPGRGFCNRAAARAPVVAVAGARVVAEQGEDFCSRAAARAPVVAVAGARVVAEQGEDFCNRVDALALVVAVGNTGR
jgi:hypothetical protein